MTGKQRVKCALSHKTPDRVPVDFGATGVTGMHVTCVARLRDHYGLQKGPVKVWEPYQMLGEIGDDLRDALAIDTVGLPGPGTLFGFRNENWKEFKAPWGQVVLVPGNFNTTDGHDGSLLIYPEGDMSVPPSGHMPAGSFFFDATARQEPIDESNLDPEDNLEEFGPLSESDLEHFKAKAEQLASSDRAVVGGIGGTGLGDIAQVPATFLKHPKGIRDVAEWYLSTLTRQDYVHAVFSRQCEIAIENLKAFHGVVGDVVDVLSVCGTDFGTQASTFCSTKTYQSLYAPYYKQINNWVHENTTWKTFKHTCGAIEAFIPLFIDSGFDILNPVQCSAAGMDPKKLKDHYGDQIVFWGGGVDTQKTLPFGTPDEVRREVLERCEVFAPNGGFVLNAIHNVQAMTPIENVVAMLDAVREFNGV